MAKQPKTLIIDGLPSCSHIRHIRLQGDRNNNKMERLNGEIRDREKTMRGLKKKRTSILQGYQLYHNFIKEHDALGNKTPAEACGTKIEGKNKWMTLIQNACKQNSN
jgi:transposase-like protein